MRLSMYSAALAVALTATVPAFAQSSSLNSINTQP
jgi:hypothetical protein